MNLEQIILKSRQLVDKIHNAEEIVFTKEDYFMLCISLFIAKKESIIKKDNENKTLIFDYSKYEDEYKRMKILFEKTLIFDPKINIFIPGYKTYDLTKKGCYNGIENIIFPFGLKIEVKNFNGSLNELNEVKRILWIYSKIRDSFIHGEKFKFDIENNRIYVNHVLVNNLKEGYEFIISFQPELLGCLSGQDIVPKNFNFIGELDVESQKKYNYFMMSILKTHDIQKIIEYLNNELVDIKDKKYASELSRLIKTYLKFNKKDNEELEQVYLKFIIRTIFEYAGKCRTENKTTEELMNILSNILTTKKEYYSLAVYSHMTFVFSNIEKINTDNIDMSFINIENDKYKKILLNHIKIVNKSFDNLLNAYQDKEKNKDTIVEELSKIINILNIRNREIVNSLRNGIAHKNVKICGDKIEIFDRKDNTDENSELSFKCEITFNEIDDFLRIIEAKHNNDLLLDIPIFLNQISRICGESNSIIKFCLYINSLKKILLKEEKYKKVL